MFFIMHLFGAGGIRGGGDRTNKQPLDGERLLRVSTYHEAGWCFRLRFSSKLRRGMETRSLTECERSAVLEGYVRRSLCDAPFDRRALCLCGRQPGV